MTVETAVWLRCNACGYVTGNYPFATDAPSDVDEARRAALRDGWATGPDGDFCPDCRALL